MTIASEITRLQNDKAAICTAIENKGVTVGNVTLDSYAACIDAIQQGAGGKYIDLLVVGGGGAGSSVQSNQTYGRGGGGGAGGYIECQHYSAENIISVSVTVGVGGTGGTTGCSGGDSCFGTIVAYGGGHGGYQTSDGTTGGSGGGGGASTSQNCAKCIDSWGGAGCIGQGNNGGYGPHCCRRSGGGGGAGGPGFPNAACDTTRVGGVGKQSDIDGTLRRYAGGGGGAGCSGGCGHDYCGGGGCGACRCQSGGAGKNGIVIVRYLTDGSCGVSCATGGTVSTSGDYTIHKFTSDGTFTIVS